MDKMSSWARKRVMKQASRDVVKVLGRGIDRGSVKEICRHSESQDMYRDEFLLSSHVMADLSVLENDQEILALVDEKGSGSKPVVRRENWPMLAAAVALLVVGVVLWGGFSPQNDAEIEQSSRYVTRVGEQKTVNLSDGSVITLNTNSQLMVSYTSERRDVALLKGEAYFDVAGDPQRPFNVALGSRDVTVLGTAFNIYKTPEKFTLALVEGVVSLRLPEQSLDVAAPRLSLQDSKTMNLDDRLQRIVSKGTVVEFDEATQSMTVFMDGEIGTRHTWREGYLSFIEAPLDQVINELNRYSGKAIVIRDASVSKLPVTGILKLGRLGRTLGGLEGSLPIQAIHHFDHIEIIGLKE